MSEHDQTSEHRGGLVPVDAGSERPLTPRQEAFCRHLAQGASAAQAARLAGYAESNARGQGHRMLMNADIRRRAEFLSSAERERRQAELAGLQAKIDAVYTDAHNCGSYSAALRCIEVEARLKRLLP
jgi:DNA-binding CsgD family transcriptional regulator